MHMGAFPQCNPSFPHDDLLHLFLARYIDLGIICLLAEVFAVLFWGLWHRVDDEERAVSQQWVTRGLGSQWVEQLPDVSQLHESRLMRLPAIIYGVGGHMAKEAVMFKGSEKKKWCKCWWSKGLVLIGLWFCHEKLNSLNGAAESWSQFWLSSLLVSSPMSPGCRCHKHGRPEQHGTQDLNYGSWSSFPSPTGGAASEAGSALTDLHQRHGQCNTSCCHDAWCR